MISECGSADASSPGAAANFSGLGEHRQVLRERSVNKTCCALQCQLVSNTYTLELQYYLNLTIKTNMSKHQAILAPREKQRIMRSNLDPRSSR